MSEDVMKDRILKAASMEIELHGAAFKMDDLAKRLNMSKRTLYEHVESKYVIIEEIVQAKAHDFCVQHTRILESSTGTVEETLREYFNVRSTLYESLNGGRFKEMFESMPHLRHSVIQAFTEDWTRLTMYLQEKQNQGHICSDVDVNTLVMMLQGFIRVVLYDRKEDPEEFYDLMPSVLRIVFDGVRERK